MLAEYGCANDIRNGRGKDLRWMILAGQTDMIAKADSVFAGSNETV